MRALRITILAALALALAGCQLLGAPSAPTSSPLAQIIDSGTLRVAISGDQPPFSMRGRDGELIGLDVDLARALAKGMSLDAVLVALPFAELLPALEANRVDVVISAMTITPERNARVPFAGPYYVSGMAALSKSPELARAASLAVLDRPGRRYAAVTGTTNERFAIDHLPQARLVPTRDFDEAVALVLADEVDAVLADLPLCRYAAMRHSDSGLRERMRPFTVEPLGIAIRADAPLLVNLVENYLDTLEYAGVLSRLKAHWLGDDAWLDEMP